MSRALAPCSPSVQASRCFPSCSTRCNRSAWVEWQASLSSGAAARRQRVAARGCATAAEQQAACLLDADRPRSQSRDQRRAAEEELRRQQQPPRFQQLMRQARVTSMAQELWQQVVQPGDCVVDATCGRGHDTAWLAQAVGPSGTVHAFDIQPAAIEATRQLVASSLPQEAAGPAVHYHQASHVEMLQRVGSGCARVVAFNLGYLPGGDQETTTTEGSTLAALQAACFVLQPGGLCTALCYTGHPGGVEEYEAVQELLAELAPEAWLTSEVRLLNRPAAPILLAMWKRP